MRSWVIRISEYHTYAFYICCDVVIYLVAGDAVIRLLYMLLSLCSDEGINNNTNILGRIKTQNNHDLKDADLWGTWNQFQLILLVMPFHNERNEMMSVRGLT